MTCNCMREPDPGVCEKDCFGPRTAGHCRCCEGCADRPSPPPPTSALGPVWLGWRNETASYERQRPALEERFQNQMDAATELIAENERARRALQAIEDLHQREVTGSAFGKLVYGCSICLRDIAASYEEPVYVAEAWPCPTIQAIRAHA